MVVWPEIGLAHGGSGGHADGEAVTDLQIVVEDTLLSVVGQEFCGFTDRGSIPGVRGRADDAVRKGEAWGECDLPKYI
jgi:hypothetical protein